MNYKNNMLTIDPAGRATLKDQVKNYIYKKIKRNVYKVNDKLPTDRDLAGQLNVSRRTVENAMRDLAGQGIIYRHVGRGSFVQQHDPGRIDIQVRPDTIMVAVPNLKNPLFCSFVAEIEKHLFQYGKRVIMASMLLLETEQDKYIRMMENADLDGIIAMAATNGFLDAVSRTHTPLVLINPSYAGERAQILVDIEMAGRLAVQHLIELGHHHIVCAGCPPYTDLANLTPRFRAAFEFLEEHGLPTENAIITQKRSLDYEAMGHELVDKILQLPQRPTGIVVYNDARAFGAINALREHGIGVPQDISVIGCDNVHMGKLFHPPLTTIDNKMEFAARKAVEMLLKNQLKQKITLLPELIRRGSCRRINQ